MKFKPGQDNVTADCLSRLPLPATDYSQEQEPEMVALLSPEFAAVTVEELKSNVSRLALNGGSRFFSLPVLPFFSLLASLSRLIY